jgi:proteic killer suppression protein
VITRIELTKKASKELSKAPTQVHDKFMSWSKYVKDFGLLEARKIKGFHDEPLTGNRKGQRSIRLNKQWRAIYIIINNKVEFVEVQEVTPHDY